MIDYNALRALMHELLARGDITTEEYQTLLCVLSDSEWVSSVADCIVQPHEEPQHTAL